jgi:hypothetical protein
MMAKHQPLPDLNRWQPLAGEMLPEVWTALWQQEDWNSGSSDSLMQLFFILLPAVRVAHRKNDEEFLLRAYAFAQWCASQPEKEFWNPAGVAFFEHVFDEDRPSDIVAWLSPKIFADIESLLEFRLGAERSREIKKMFAARTVRKNEKYASMIASAERRITA